MDGERRARATPTRPRSRPRPLIAAESDDRRETDALDWLAAAQLGNGSARERPTAWPTPTRPGSPRRRSRPVAGTAELADAQALPRVSLQYDLLRPGGPARWHRVLRRRPARRRSPSDEDLRATPQADPRPRGQLAARASTVVRGRDAPGPPPRRAPPPRPRRSPTSTVAPTSSGAPTEGAGGSDPSAPVDSSATGSLAQTGTDLLAPAMLGLLLVVVGGLAVWATSRRRGAHA